MWKKLILACGCLGLLLAARSGSAQLQYPLDVASAEDGTLFVADRKLPGIWKISDGKLSIHFQASKVFRTPLNAVRCLAITTDGTLLAGDSATREVYAFDSENKPQPLTNGKVGIPSDLLVDGDTVYVSDLELQRVWSFPAAGGEPQEVAVLAGVRGLAMHPNGKLLCCTTLEDPLQTVGDDGQLETLLSGRPFQLPHHIAVHDQHVFVADNYAGTIWKVGLDDKLAVEAFAKGEPLKKPVGLCLQGSDVLVADPHARSIFRITADGKVEKIAIVE